MKALKIIGIIIAVLIAAILIVPLFTASPAVVKASTEISLEPEQIFPSVASFEGRDLWDPWLSADSTAVATIDSKAGYVGSSYAWEGVAVGTGKMEVISVKENEYIESHLWFGDVDSPALVEWAFEQVDGGTNVVWSFTQETKYPFGRLGMIFGTKAGPATSSCCLPTSEKINPYNSPSTAPILSIVPDASDTIASKAGCDSMEIGPRQLN